MLKKKKKKGMHIHMSTYRSMPNKTECMVYKLPMHILCFNCNKHLREIIAWYFSILNS